MRSIWSKPLSIIGVLAVVVALAVGVTSPASAALTAITFGSGNQLNVGSIGYSEGGLTFTEPPPPPGATMAADSIVDRYVYPGVDRNLEIQIRTATTVSHSAIASAGGSPFSLDSLDVEALDNYGCQSVNVEIRSSAGASVSATGLGTITFVGPGWVGITGFTITLTCTTTTSAVAAVNVDNIVIDMQPVAPPDTTPPTVTCSVTPNSIWPPNHKMVNVNASVSVTDAGSGPAGFTLVSVTSNEPDNGLGDGDTANDIQGWAIGTPDTSGQVRAERSGRGSGRVYTLTYAGMDQAGNSASCSTTISVPHDKGK